jgi:xanthine dehydrogenase molybdenum-binding subunit
MSLVDDRTIATGEARGKIRLTLNGRQVEADPDPNRSLLSVLREDFGCISLKNGCEPQASCGCCTLLIDGKPRLCCTMKASQVAGKDVVTLEGLPQQTRKNIADSFVSCGGVQCGFCIPGMAMRGHAIVKENSRPTRKQIAHELRAHLCRCTGYVKIVDAIEQLACTTRGEAGRAIDRSGRIGTSLERYNGRDLVLGDFRYIDDIFVEGSLFAAMRFSDHPRAVVKSIDTRPALEVDGVERVLTAGDVPGNSIVGLITKDWPILVPIGQETRCVGDVLAIVVAKDQRTARRAAELIAVDYQILPPITDPRDALKPDAPRIHANGNLLSRSAIHRGDARAALAGSAHVVEDTFHTQRIEHMFLEPEACIAVPILQPGDNGNGNGPMRLKVLSQGQGIFDDRRQIASILGWSIDRVEVELVQNGGAFGGKEDMSIQGQTALAAALVGKPVKCTLTREESFRLHPKRHPISIDLKVGCDALGNLTAVWARMIGDKGAYASVGAKVLERAAGHACGPYRVPDIDVEALAVYTNNPPCGAMRGFGANQAAFAIESLLNRLADKVGIDAWEIRWRNALDVGDRFATGQKMEKPFGLKKTLLAVREIFRGARYAGIACGIKNVGIGNGMPDPGKALLHVESDGRITIRTGFTEMGQGFFTVLIQTAVEETGLPPRIFRPMTDTSAELDCGQTTASRATVLGCRAVLEACRKLKADLDAGATLEQLAGRDYYGEWICNFTNKLEAKVAEPKTHLTYGFATQVVILDEAGRIQKVIAAHDVGKVMNPTLLQGQMEGSIHMGLGYALTEDFVCEGGRIVSDSIKSVGVLRAHQMPEVQCIFVEEADPDCPYGARGVGEIGLVPTAPAVAGAMRAFDGIERTRLPMKDSPAARAILATPRKAEA